MPKPGLLLVFTRLKEGADISSEEFQRWYDEVHTPDVLATSGVSEAYRYNAVLPSADWQFLALYPVSDVSFLESPEFAAIPWDGKHVFKGDTTDHADGEIRFYELIQTFEPRGIKIFDKAPCVITVSMEPKEGTDSDFDDWYRKQHLDALSMVMPYRCATRYLLRKSTRDDTPRYLALHEWDTTDLPTEQIDRSKNTEWSKKILAEAKAFEPLPWKFVKAYGQPGTFGQ